MPEKMTVGIAFKQQDLQAVKEESGESLIT